jgi:predicted PurR-regulated permease PerM
MSATMPSMRGGAGGGPKSAEPAKKAHSVTSYIIFAAALVAFIEMFSLLSPILLSFLLILLVSLAFNPVVYRMRALTGGRKAATGLVATGLIGIMALTGWAFFGPMNSSVAKLSEQLPVYWERLQKPLIKMETRAVLSEQKLQAEVATEIVKGAAATGKPLPLQNPADLSPSKAASGTGSIRSSLSQMMQKVAGSFTAVAFNATHIIVVLVTVFFGVTFTLMNPRPIFGAIFQIVPERHHDKTLVILNRIGQFVPAWAFATLLAMLTVGVLVFALMWPFLGFADALALGLIAGVLEAIPYLGPLVSAVPAVLFALGEGGMTPLWVILVYLGVQLLENNVISPVIMSRSMKLHSVAVIFSVLLCVAAFGVLGVLVAVPLAAIAEILHDELYRKRFLPNVTDADLERLARAALGEKPVVRRP